jgi:hypothetical protein
MSCGSLFGGTPYGADSCVASPTPPPSGLLVEVGGAGEPFRPLLDGDSLPLEFGSQGGQMVSYRLQLSASSGGELPDCLPQTASLVAGPGQIHASLDVALRTYPSAMGRTTQATYLIFDSGPAPAPGSQVTLRVTASGQTLERKLVLSSRR